MLIVLKLCFTGTTLEKKKEGKGMKGTAENAGIFLAYNFCLVGD